MKFKVFSLSYPVWLIYSEIFQSIKFVTVENLALRSQYR